VTLITNQLYKFGVGDRRSPPPTCCRSSCWVTTTAVRRRLPPRRVLPRGIYCRAAPRPPPRQFNCCRRACHGATLPVCRDSSSSSTSPPSASTTSIGYRCPIFARNKKSFWLVLKFLKHVIDWDIYLELLIKIKFPKFTVVHTAACTPYNAVIDTLARHFRWECYDFRLLPVGNLDY